MMTQRSLLLVISLFVLRAWTSGAKEVKLYQTAELFPSGDNPDRLRLYNFSTVTERTPDVMTLSIDVNTTYQTLKGFGGAFTDAVAHVFSGLNSTLQEQVLELLWGPTGQQYNLARLTIGATDFSVDVYNYDMTEGDYNMSHFTIDHDREKIIPMILRAQAKAAKTAATFGYRGGLESLSTSWSPPGWMKRPYLALKGWMRNSAKPGMIDDPKIYSAYALYLSRYLTEYKSAGVNITLMTIQNEPDSADHQFPVAYPCCNFNGTGEGLFLRNYLGPKIRADHPDVAIYVQYVSWCKRG